MQAALNKASHELLQKEQILESTVSPKDLGFYQCGFGELSIADSDLNSGCMCTKDLEPQLTDKYNTKKNLHWKVQVPCI